MEYREHIWKLWVLWMRVHYVFIVEPTYNSMSSAGRIMTVLVSFLLTDVKVKSS